MISIYETDSIFLGVLGCVFLCLYLEDNRDNYLTGSVPCLPLLEEVSESLNKAAVEGRLAWEGKFDQGLLSDQRLVSSSMQHFDTNGQKIAALAPNESRSLNRVTLSSGNRPHSAGVIGWKPIDEWIPSAKRMTESFRKLLLKVNIIISKVHNVDSLETFTIVFIIRENFNLG